MIKQQTNITIGLEKLGVAVHFEDAIDNIPIEFCIKKKQ